MADIADGKLHLFAFVGLQVVGVFLPAGIVGLLVVVLVQAYKVRLCRVVCLRGDIYHEALGKAVGSLGVEREHILGAYGDGGRDEPVVIGITAVGTGETDILLAVVRTQDGVVVPPHRVYGERVDHLGILQYAAVGVGAYQGSGGFHVYVDAGPSAKVDGEGLVALEVIEESRFFRVP